MYPKHPRANVRERELKTELNTFEQFNISQNPAVLKE